MPGHGAVTPVLCSQIHWVNLHSTHTGTMNAGDLAHPDRESWPRLRGSHGGVTTPTRLQVEAVPPLGLRGPESPAAAQVKQGGCRPGAAPPESAVLPSLLSREGSSKYTEAAHTPHRELQFGRWQSQLG